MRTPHPSVKKNIDEKYKEYCNKQTQLLQELANLQKEIVMMGEEEQKDNKFRDEYITDWNINKKVINIKEHFEEENVLKLNELLKNEDRKSVILLVDGNKNLWELIKRSDLNENSLKSPESIQPIITYPQKFVELEFGEENKSMKNSEVELSKESEFNISNLIKDTEHEISTIKI